MLVVEGVENEDAGVCQCCIVAGAWLVCKTGGTVCRPGTSGEGLGTRRIRCGFGSGAREVTGLIEREPMVERTGMDARVREEK